MFLRTRSLTSLFFRLQIKIFKDLDWAIYSTCLGLTCKQLYSIHRRLHGTVKLTDIGYTCPSVADEWVDNSHFLHELLTSWIPSTLIYSPYDPPCFTSKERFYEMARTGSWDGGVILQSVNHQSLALRYV
jgi:hypothetical protein